MNLEPMAYRVYGHPFKHHAVFVQKRSNNTWAVTLGWDGGGVLNTDGEFEYEPSPSNRDDDFIARTRYPTIEAALAEFEKHLPKLGSHW